HFPEPVINFFSVLSGANMPLSMILLGLMLNFSIDKRFLPIALKYLGLHYGLGILAGLLVYFLLPVDDQMINTTLHVAWLLPIVVAMILYYILFQYQTLLLVGMVSTLTIVISIIMLYIYQALFV